MLRYLREAHRPVDPYLRFKDEIVASENPAAESIEGTNSMREPVVHLSIQSTAVRNPGISLLLTGTWAGKNTLVA